MKRYLLYIFDLDGTLVDSLNGLKMCYKQALDELGLKYDSDDLSDYIRESLQSTYNRFDNPGFTYETFEKTVYNAYEITMDAYSFPYPDTYPALLELKKRGASMCIATKSRVCRTKNVLEIHNLDGFFDHIVGYDSVKKQKPDPECLEICASFYDVEKKDILFVGDSDTDVIAAEAFGIDSAFVERGKNGYHDCTYRLRNLKELLDSKEV